MKKLNKLLVYIALATMPMLFSHCTLTEDLGKLKTSLDSVKIALGTPQFNTLAHLKFVDAATNLPIEDQDVKVTISGKDAALMYNNMGAHLTEYTGKWGLLDLVVDPHKVDTAALRSNPIEFVITPTMAGYVGDPQKVFLLNPGTNNITLSMINLSAPPAGYYSSTNVIVGNTNSNGQISGGTQISLAPRRISRTTSVLGNFQGTIQFLSGTTFLDASGNTLIGSLSYDFSSMGDDRNGWPLYTHTGNWYKKITKYFAFSLQFYITPIGGVKTPVANFGNNGGIIFASGITSNFINELTGVAYKEGDKIDRWQTTSLLDGGSNINSTQDVIRQMVSLGGDGLGLKDTLKNVSDLKSTWGIAKNASPVSATININGVITRPNTLVNLLIQKHDLNYTQTGWGELLSWRNLDLYNPTGSKQLIYYYLTTDSYGSDFFSIQDSYGLTIYPQGFSYTPDFSSSTFGFTQNITVAEDIASATDLVTANINLTVESQSSPSIGIKPNVNIQVGVSGNMQTYKLKDGKTSLSLKIDQPYIVRGQFGTSSAVGILTVKKVDKNYVGTFQLSMGSTLGQEQTFTVVNNGDKTIDINYTISVSSDVFNQFRN